MDWKRLFDSHADDLIGICWRILGRRADVEDCVQEVFVKAFQMERRETIRNWPGLLRRLAVLTALEALRKRKRRQDALLSEHACDLAAREDGADEIAIHRELESRLRREVAALPDQEAAVFCLRYFESATVSETASTLGVSTGAVAAASLRARKRLQQRMSDVLPARVKE
ncbi:MAG: sigma-70 family RNA polymerase sigma factor [Planctomycetota bacterium]